MSFTTPIKGQSPDLNKHFYPGSRPYFSFHWPEDKYQTLEHGQYCFFHLWSQSVPSHLSSSYNYYKSTLCQFLVYSIVTQYIYTFFLYICKKIYTCVCVCVLFIYTFLYDPDIYTFFFSYYLPSCSVPRDWI